MVCPVLDPNVQPGGGNVRLSQLSSKKIPDWIWGKVAVTFRACDIVTVHGVTPPVQSPDHWKNCQPCAGVVVSWTLVPEVNDCEHVPGQLILPGLEVTVPVPETATVSGKVC